MHSWPGPRVRARAPYFALWICMNIGSRILRNIYAQARSAMQRWNIRNADERQWKKGESPRQILGMKNALAPREASGAAAAGALKLRGNFNYFPGDSLADTDTRVSCSPGVSRFFSPSTFRPRRQMNIKRAGVKVFASN